MHFNVSTINSSNESTLDAVGSMESLPEALVQAVSVIYALIFIIGIIGNSLVILVIIKDRKMRTVANFFLVSLSAADLMIILFCLPVSVYESFQPNHWILGDLLCKLTPYLQYVSVNASVLTMLAISIERLFVITVPLKARSYCTKGRTTTTIIGIWVLCGVTSTPAAMFAEVVNGTAESGSTATMCIQNAGQEWFNIAQIGAFYVCPGISLLIIYSSIIKALRDDTSGGSFHSTNSNSRRISQKRETRQQLILMLGAVVIAYFICLLPFNGIVLLVIFSPETMYSLGFYNFTVILTVARVLFFINSCINPILYNAISGKFRAAFVRLFCFRKANEYPELRRKSELRYMPSVGASKSSTAHQSMASEVLSHDNSICTILVPPTNPTPSGNIKFIFTRYFISWPRPRQDRF